MSEIEQVLVIPTPVFHELGCFQGFNKDIDKYWETIVNPEVNFFMPRPQAEESPEFKQIIPYALLHCEGKFLHYTRGSSGGEGRLHAKGSLGIGGHINPIDSETSSLGEDVYLAGIERELHEELIINTGLTQKIVGLINDDSNEVGAVHLGVVHLIELESLDVAGREDCIENAQFLSIEEIQTEYFEHLETWSQFAFTLAIEELKK